jgi:hypothetical protein
VKGLPSLAKGTDAELKGLAARDLDGPTAAPDQTALADGWWDAGEKRTGAARVQLRRRAVLWYQKSLTQTTGLTRAKLERRIREIAPDWTPPREGAVTFEKLEHLDKVVTSGGTWTVEGNELLGSCVGDTQWATLATSYRSMTQVTLRARIVPPAKNNLRYWVGNLHFIFNHEVGVRTEFRVGPSMVVMNRRYLTPGKEHEITLKQEGPKVILTIDGQKEWEAETMLSGTVSIQAAWGTTLGIREIQVIGTPDPSIKVVPPSRPH